MNRLLGLAALLLLPLALASCVLTPGKFVSTLRIDADGHFAFTYVGEVHAIDDDEIGAKARAAGERAKAPPKESAEAMTDAIPDAKPDPAGRRAQADAQNRAIAATLAKEAGYRSVTYAGNGKFVIDYAVAGMLDHAFVFPYNLDAEAVFPFIAIEPRQGGVVRVKAPGFANDSSGKDAFPGADQNPSKLDGSFTLDTDAAIVSQNSEDGAKPGAGGRRTITWQATPLTKDAPTAVLKLK